MAPPSEPLLKKPKSVLLMAELSVNVLDETLRLTAPSTAIAPPVVVANRAFVFPAVLFAKVQPLIVADTDSE